MWGISRPSGTGLSRDLVPAPSRVPQPHALSGLTPCKLVEFLGEERLQKRGRERIPLDLDSHRHISERIVCPHALFYTHLVPLVLWRPENGLSLRKDVLQKRLDSLLDIGFDTVQSGTR